MAVDGINTTQGSGAGAARTNGFAALTSEQFVRIMMTELTNQDPLKPNDSNALLQQMSQLRSIESDMNLTNKLGALVTQNEFSASSGLIGAMVSGVSEENQRVQGVVLSISRTADGPVLNLATGQRVKFKNVDQIIDPRLADTNQPPANNGSGNNGGTPGTTPTQPTGTARDPDAGRPVPQNLDPSIAPALGGRGD